jgi:tetratricopeptide (TPR) repeat protein
MSSVQVKRHGGTRGECRRGGRIHGRITDPALNAGHLTDLGSCHFGLGEYRQAIDLLGQAVSIADAAGDSESAVMARLDLARAHLQLGDPATALLTVTQALDLPYPLGKSTLRLLEGLALLELNRPEESVQAFSDAATAADALLALAGRNVDALQARALALSGLAATTGDPARAAEAGRAFARAEAITNAAGMAADTRTLLGQIARHDTSNILAEIRATQDQ